jgi:hypothetical protein
VSSGLARTALSNRIWIGISREWLARLIGDLAAPWAAAEEDRLLARREHARLRAAGAGPDHDLPFTDLICTTGSPRTNYRKVSTLRLPTAPL